MLVFYNGVVLNRCLTKSWEETVEYDETGMNLIGSRITITFEGTVMPQFSMAGGRATYRGVYPPNRYENHFNFYPYMRGEGTINSAIELTNDGTPAYMGAPLDGGIVEPFSDRLNIILRQLQMPRAALFVYNDLPTTKSDQDLVLCAFGTEEQARQYASSLNMSAQQAVKHVDVNGGPKPKNVSLTDIYNEYARISFTVEVFRIRCLGGDIDYYLTGLGEKNPADGFIVSNRCWTEETIDKNFYTTRVYTGKLRISSTEKSVHFYRHAYYPPLEEGFRRESVRFSESEDGLSLSYSITDRQVRCSAPFPATEFSGQVRYRVENSAMISLSMELTLVGRPDADKSLLVERGMYAVMKRVQDFTTGRDSNGNAKNYGGFQTDFVVSENIGDPPSVTISTSFKLFGDVSETMKKLQSNGNEILEEQMAHGLSQIGKPIDFSNTDDATGTVIYTYNRYKSDNPNPYGYAVYRVFDDQEMANAASDSQAGLVGYIKCVATMPCTFQNVKTVGGETTEAAIDSMTPTYLARDPRGVEYTTERSGASKEAITQPFSFYKSDITYYTDQSRFVLPQARPAGASLGSRQEILGSIRQLQSTIDSLKAMDPYEEIPVNYFLTPSTETGDDSGGDEQPPVETIAVWELLEKNETELERQKNKLNNARIVQLARPVPKAVVTIEAERFGRLPEFPDPNEVVVTQWDEGCQDEPLYFTPLKFEVKLGEPRPGKNTTAAVSYNAVATYEYALSREYKKGDRVWLLHNPTFPSTCYFPRNNDGSIEPAALSTLFNGEGLNHGSLESQETPPEEQGGETEPPNIDI